MTKKEFFSFKSNKFFWLNILGMCLFVVIALVAALKWLDFYTQHGEGIEVPDLKGLSLNEAEARLKADGLEMSVIDSTYIAGYPYGCIIEQNPAIGVKVKQKHRIYVTINTNSVPLRAIPDIIDNCSLREAQAKVSASGFTLGENEFIQGETDWVYGVKYRGLQLATGAKVPVGATLVLVVGNNDLMLDDMELDSLDLQIGTGKRGANDIDTIPYVEDSWF